MQKYIYLYQKHWTIVYQLVARIEQIVDELFCDKVSKIRCIRLEPSTKCKRGTDKK